MEPSLVRSLGSSPASRLMAWSLDRADLNPGISAVRSSMPPSPILAVTLAFTHRDEELFRLRHCQVAHAQDGLVSLTNHSVHFAGNVAWHTHASHVPIRVRTSCVSEECFCNVDWESALSEGRKFLDEVCPFVKKNVEFVFLCFVAEGSRVAVVAVLLVASSRLELRWKMMGASALFIPVLSTMLELWESPLGFVHMVDLSLLSSRPRGENFFWRRARPPARGSALPLRVGSS